jgi:spiro-SPASM protein
MNALAVLYGGNLSAAAFEKVFSGKCALSLALEGAAAFPGTAKRVLLGGNNFDRLAGAAGWTLPEGVELRAVPDRTKKSLLETLASLSGGFDLTYYGWADCPLLDPVLTEALARRHLRYAAEYSYADGWPYGFAPELLAPGVAGILAKLLGDGDGGKVERDALFQVIQRDINAFDIETEISPADLRGCRLNLTADSRRNLLLLTRLTGAGLRRARDAEGIITGKPELLRTLPVFYALQVSGPCLQACEFCPYPRFGRFPGEGPGPEGQGTPVTERKDFLEPGVFEALLDRIISFSGDGVIDISLWGELSLHPQKMELIRQVLARPELSLIIETSGLGWKQGELEDLAALAAAAPVRNNPILESPLSWIVSLDSADPGTYQAIRGPGFAEAAGTARFLAGLFPGDAYVQAIRVQGREDDIEQFYRSWKAELPQGGSRVIIQKYDDFCGFLPKRQASDLSPVNRQPCWHLMRDMNIYIDGTVAPCRNRIPGLGAESAAAMGNAFREPLEEIWSRFEDIYGEQCSRRYPGICADCDEYYTFNF